MEAMREWARELKEGTVEGGRERRGEMEEAYGVCLARCK